MPGRRWSDGLHQAIEAKEGLEVKEESITLASISYQALFRMFPRLAGMTGTAATGGRRGGWWRWGGVGWSRPQVGLAAVSDQCDLGTLFPHGPAVSACWSLCAHVSAHSSAVATDATCVRLSSRGLAAIAETKEFKDIYGLDVTVVPPNRIIQRDDFDDVVFARLSGKWNAVVTEVKRMNKKGRPVLVGTTSVEGSEMLARESGWGWDGALGVGSAGEEYGLGWVC